METKRVELAEPEQISVENPIRGLLDLQLALVGGGIGDVIVG